MKIPSIISITEARKRIFEILEYVQTPGVTITLTENGQAGAVIMSAKEFESWKETLDTISDIPDIGRQIESAKKDYVNGKFLVLRDIKAKYNREDGSKKVLKKSKYLIKENKIKRSKK